MVTIAKMFLIKPFLKLRFDCTSTLRWSVLSRYFQRAHRWGVRTVRITQWIISVLILVTSLDWSSSPNDLITNPNYTIYPPKLTGLFPIALGWKLYQGRDQILRIIFIASFRPTGFQEPKGLQGPKGFEELQRTSEAILYIYWFLGDFEFNFTLIPLSSLN